MSLITILSSVVVVVLIFIDGSAAVDIELDVSNPIREVSDSVAFARFTQRYGKRYQNTEEIRLRFSIFKENRDFITRTNKKGLSYKVGVNQYADLTWQEFQKRTKRNAAQNCSVTVPDSDKIKMEGFVPVYQNWTAGGVVSPVKNQVDCSSSWAFSTTGALESAYRRSGLGPILASEQELLDCSTDFGSNGCDGGTPYQAFKYINFTGSIAQAINYPYRAIQGVCPKFEGGKYRIKVFKPVFITPGAEDELEYAVGNVQPVSVSFEARRSLMFYKSGVYTDSQCGNTSMDVNHSGLAVGYGTEDGIPYWLIKNSWGLDWGDLGYFKMEMGKNMCGIASCALYPVVV